MKQPNPSLRQHLIELFHRDKLKCFELSARELYVARLLAWGNSKKEIAETLCISFHTVNAHIRNIYEKLNLNKETDLTRWYIFKEYGIADNPLKRAITGFFLLITISSIMAQADNVRVLRTRIATRSARVVRQARSGSRHKKTLNLNFA